MVSELYRKNGIRSASKRWYPKCIEKMVSEVYGKDGIRSVSKTVLVFRDGRVELTMKHTCMRICVQIDNTHTHAHTYTRTHAPAYTRLTCTSSELTGGSLLSHYSEVSYPVGI